MLDSTDLDGAHDIPECSGNEDRLSLCMTGSQDRDECRPALVDCSTQTAGREEVDVDTTTYGSEDGATAGTDSTVEDGGESGTISIDLVAVIAVSAVLLVMIVLVLVSAVIIVQLCRGKRKRKVLPQVGSSGGITQQTNTRYIPPQVQYIYIYIYICM